DRGHVARVARRPGGRGPRRPRRDPHRGPGGRAVTAIAVCGGMIIAAITVIFVVLERREEAKYMPRHAARPDWWDEKPPMPAAVEVLTGPGTAIAQTSEVTIGVLARVRDRLRE